MLNRMNKINIRIVRNKRCIRNMGSIRHIRTIGNVRSADLYFEWSLEHLLPLKILDFLLKPFKGPQKRDRLKKNGFWNIYFLFFSYPFLQEVVYRRSFFRLLLIAITNDNITLSFQKKRKTNIKGLRMK